MNAIYWKELADHFGRRRFLLLLGLVAIGTLWGVYVTTQAVQGGTGSLDQFLFLDIFTSGSGVLPSLLFFISFFGPLIGIALGFDAVNSERTHGTLSRILAQPVYRDAVINGKFLAGVTALAVVIVSMELAIIGLGMFILGFAPRGEEIVRIVGFTLVSIAYLAFWLALATTASVFLRNTVASALVTLGIWLFSGFIILLLANVAADYFAPLSSNAADAARNFSIQTWISRVSPGFLFQEATQTLLDPLTSRSQQPLDLIFSLSPERLEGLLLTPISAAESLKLVWPHIVALITGVAILFTGAYAKFMREEIRS
ncbi:MAG: ABC transporter [SAR202 cluster bacterium]|nr:ABC transporter [SAR202 cluster bacterium]